MQPGFSFPAVSRTLHDPLVREGWEWCTVAPFPAGPQQGPGAASPGGYWSEATSGCSAPTARRSEGRRWGQLEGRPAWGLVRQDLHSPKVFTCLEEPAQNKTKRSGEQVGQGFMGEAASRPVMFTSTESGGGRSLAYPFPSLLFSISFRASSRNGGAWAHPDPFLPRPTQTDTGRRKQKARKGWGVGSPF